MFQVSRQPLKYLNKCHPGLRRYLIGLIQEIRSRPFEGKPVYETIVKCRVWKGYYSGSEYRIAYIPYSLTSIMIIFIGPRENFYNDMRNTYPKGIVS